MSRLTPSICSHGGQRRRRRLVLMVATALGTVLAGCTHMQKVATIDRHVIVGAVPEDYRTTHPIAIEEGIETMDIPAGLNVVRIPDPMKGNIAGFAQQYLASGSAVIAIVTPSGSTNQAAARALSGQIQEVLVAAGVDPKAIEYRSYRAEAAEVTAPIRLAYSKIGAHTAGCGPWPDQFGNHIENRQYFNYGCASQQNLAAIVTNPLDLIYPQGMTPPDATRKSGIVGNYQGIAGAPRPGATQGNYSNEAPVAIARGVGNE